MSTFSQSWVAPPQHRGPVSPLRDPHERKRDRERGGTASKACWCSGYQLDHGDAVGEGADRGASGVTAPPVGVVVVPVSVTVLVTETVGDTDGVASDATPEPSPPEPPAGEPVGVGTGGGVGSTIAGSVGTGVGVGTLERITADCLAFWNHSS